MNKKIIFGLLLLIVGALGGIGVTGALAVASDGATLYAANCEGCHGANGAGTSIAPNIQGASASEIQGAINEVSAMSGLKSLSLSDIQAIASFLSSGPAATPVPTPVPTPSPTPAPTAGSALFAASCQGCHGVNGAGTSIAPGIQGASASDIREAINEVPVMSGLKSLTNADIQAIASFLSSAQATAPTGGAEGSEGGDD